MRMVSVATLSRLKVVAVGAQLLSGSDAQLKLGNALPFAQYPCWLNDTLHRNDASKALNYLAPLATSVQLLAREGSYAQLRLRSGEIRKVHIECRATIGEGGNGEHSLRSIGQGRANRWRGIRPTVRVSLWKPG